ncbi:MFS transporter [Brevibacterium samyangense]|uniref:MFS transporter n=1 Tax=Brevibacterium samyangense TaxID=366888 RepID=A0ABN2T6E9_9MICO
MRRSPGDHDGGDGSPQAIWTKDFVLAFGFAAFLAFIFYLLVTAMAGFAVHEFAASDTVSGFAATGFVVGALGARMFVGPLMDVVGRYRMMLIGAIASVVLVALYAFVPSVTLLIVLRLLHGLAYGIAHTTISAAVQSLIPANRRAEGTGYFMTSTVLATAFGPLLAVVLVNGPGYDALFLVATVFAVLGLAVVLLMRLPRVERKRFSFAALNPRGLFDKDGVRMGLVMTLGGIAYSSIMAFLAGYVTDLGMPNAASVFFLVFALATVICRVFLGKVQDARGDNVVIYPLFLVYAGSLLIVSFAHGWFAIVLAGLLAGTGWGTLMSGIQAIAVRAAGPARTGIATSSFFFMLDLGFGLGPILLGLVSDSFGMAGMYRVAAGIVVLAGVLYVLVHGRFQGGGAAGRTREVL